MMGDKDKIVPEINGRWIASLAPNAKLHIVQGGGHLFLVSFAEKIVPVMRDFFDEGEFWYGKTMKASTGSAKPAAKKAA